MINSNDIVYISGPMTGKPFLNFPTFYAMESFLRNKYKCKVLNPARNEFGLSDEQYLEIDLAMVRICSVLFQLKDWRESNGCRREFKEARRWEKRIIQENDLNN